MLTKTNYYFFTLIGLSLLLAIPSAQGKMYRWYDEDGNAHFTDKIQPEDAKFKRESLTNQARVIKKETVEAAKSKEHLEIQLRLKALRVEQEKVVKKQHAHDKVLRSTFRSVEDMESALSRKTKSFENRERGIQRQLEFQKNNLHEQQRFAANYERLGKSIPNDVITQITTFETRIAETEERLATLSNEKQKDLNLFKADIKRFKFLTAVEVQDKQLIDEQTEIKTATILGLFTCNNVKQCDKAWVLAKQFVQTYSNTSIELESEELILTTMPKNSQNISLSASKLIKRDKKPQIFLDIRCHDSAIGKALCSDVKIKNIRKSFRPYILSNLTVQ